MTSGPRLNAKRDRDEDEQQAEERQSGSERHREGLQVRGEATRQPRRGGPDRAIARRPARHRRMSSPTSNPPRMARP